jgi:hypothetical protein
MADTNIAQEKSSAITKDDLLAALKDVSGNTAIWLELGWGPTVAIVDVVVQFKLKEGKYDLALSTGPNVETVFLWPPCELSRKEG